MLCSKAVTALDVQVSLFPGLPQQNLVFVDRLLETISPDWAGPKQIHSHMVDVAAGLLEVTGRLETLPGLDGDLAPRGGMLAALREPRLTKCQNDFGWSTMEGSLASVPRHFSWDSEVFMVLSDLEITMEIGGGTVVIHV